MATRIDIEITSDLGDGSFTWRAAGAKQPKGVFAGALLPSGASVGDVLRAEAEFTVDGPEIVSLAPVKAAKANTIERLELITNDGPVEGVTTQLAKKGRGGGGKGRGRGGPRGDRGGRDFGDSRGRDANRGGDRKRSDRGQNRRPQLQPRREHRQAWVASLPEGHQPVAEQLIHEGRDGVAAALERQNKAAVADGREPVDTGPIMRIADKLAPAMATAEWRDQADAAIDAVDKVDPRELRRVLIAGDEYLGHRDTAEKQAMLRSKLGARLDRDYAEWGRDVRQALTEGRVVRALRQSGRPPRAGVPMPDDLVEQLSTATMTALDPAEEPHRWTMVIEALAFSPIRRLVVPEEKPEQSDDELLDTIERLANRIPGVAALFDIEPAPRSRKRQRRN